MASVFEGVWPSGARVRWRLLKWQEHRKIAPLLASDPGSAYLAAYRTALISGPDPAEAPAGIVFWIGQSLLNKDPFFGQYESIHKTLEAARATVQSSYMEIVRAIVCHVFSLKPQEVDQLDSGDFFRLVAAAEVILGQPVNPVNPAEPPHPSAKAHGQRRR